MTAGSINAGRVLGKVAAGGKGDIRIPTGTAEALEGLGLGYLVRTWLKVSWKLWKMSDDQGVLRTGGAEPGDFKHKLRTDCHPKTVERHLRILEQHGFLERNDVPVPGRTTRFPRRGPKSRVRYWLYGATVQWSWPKAKAKAKRPRPAAPAAQQPPTAPEPRQEATRGPPETLPATDPDGPRSAREALTRLEEKYGR